ncbi:trypsin-like peptidase domain-containing protein [Rhodobacteraceae bacterium NNCM2]|nr:trypsin-like peptidase domain-containing protein [Coraliihabitans acroporae]
MDTDQTSLPDGGAQPASDDVRALLEALTGASRGRITWLTSERSRIRVDDDRALRVVPETGQTAAPARARVSWTGETYEIEALADNDIWVNGRKIGTAQLLHGDMVEFGEDGPMARFRLCRHKFPTRWPLEEILSDAMAYARSSRRPFGKRVSNALVESVRRILMETSMLFRMGVVLVLIVLTAFVVMQYRSDQRLQQSIQEEAQRLEAIAIALADTRREALTAAELATLRDQLDLRLRTNADRLALLERRLGASARVISESTASVAFVQGAYGLRQVESGKMLRHVLGPDGRPLQTPLGQPVVDVDGEGKPVEFQFTGTGFLLRDSGQLVTNRHVALPWTAGDRVAAFEQGGFSPEMLKLVAFLPGLPEAVEATFLSASDTADLALLAVSATAMEGRGLVLSQGSAEIGDEVIVMGFPTGLRALLAQAGREFLSELEETGEPDFWTVAARLSERGMIAPLASRGIIAQITPKAVIYDAETTVGGSGGPALDIDGNVIAVNAAILPEFGGANIGVPVEEVHRLLAEAAGN